MIKKNGLTLIEMLVVIAVLSIVGVLLLTIFTSTLKGSNKSQVISAIKQNGQSVLENMDKTIRNADNVVCTSTPDALGLVVLKNGVYTRYRFIKPTTSPATNGSIQQDSPDKTAVGLVDLTTGKEYTDPAFKNKVCSDLDPMISPVTLTDTNTKTGISVESGLFSHNPAAGFRDQVTVSFNLKPGVEAPQSITGQIDPVTFQTSIQLR